MATLDYPSRVTPIDSGRLGRASLWLGLFAWIFLGVGIAMIVGIEETPGVPDGGIDPLVMLLNMLVMMMAVVLSITGIVIGAVGLGKNRIKRRLALYGFILSLSMWLLVLTPIAMRLAAR